MAGGQALCQDAHDLDKLMTPLLRRFRFVGASNIDTFADRFCQHIRVAGVPRDPFEHLPRLSILLERTVLSRPTRALWVREGDQYFVYFSMHENTSAARFSLWHECFEILANHPQFPTALSASWLERLADKFACCVLMPAEPVRRAATRLRSNPDGLVPVMAERFSVSQTAMRRRLRELGIALARPAR